MNLKYMFLFLLYLCKTLLYDVLWNCRAEIKFNARELRNLRMLFYFQKGLKVDGLLETPQLRTAFTKAAISLASSKPFQVPISAIKVVHQHQEVKHIISNEFFFVCLSQSSE